MEHGVDFILAEHALDACLIADVPACQHHAAVYRFPQQRGIRNPITDNRDHVCPGFDEAVDEPASQKPACARDERWAIAPEGCVHGGHTTGENLCEDGAGDFMACVPWFCHTAQGAFPFFHKSFKKRNSRYVSIAKKNPSCL